MWEREIGRGRGYSPAVKTEVLRRLAAGQNRTRLHGELGIARETLRLWARQAGLAHNRSGRPSHPGREKYHQLRVQGFSRAAAAEAAGVGQTTSLKWEREVVAGGYKSRMRPELRGRSDVSAR